MSRILLSSEQYAKLSGLSIIKDDSGQKYIDFSDVTDLDSLKEDFYAAKVYDVDLTAFITHKQQMDNVMTSINHRKEKYGLMLETVKSNPEVDMNTEILPMLAEFTNQVEGYKYSSEGKTYLMAELQKEINNDGAWKDVLERIITLPNPLFPNGMKTIEAINAAL